MLEQMDQRQSIIHQGDVYIQRKNQKEALRLADFDSKQMMPQQIWYDQLRGSDDGSFSKTAITNQLQGTDPIDYQHRGKVKNHSKADREKYLKEKFALIKQ